MKSVIIFLTLHLTDGTPVYIKRDSITTIQESHKTTASSTLFGTDYKETKCTRLTFLDKSICVKETIGEVMDMIK